MKIRLSIDFDSATEYEAFRRQVSIEEVKAEAKKPAEKPAEKKKTEAKEEPAPAPEFKDVTPEDGMPFEEHTESELKVLLSTKLKEGKKTEVKDFFSRHGVASLSALLEKKDELDFAAVYAEAEAI